MFSGVIKYVLFNLFQNRIINNISNKFKKFPNKKAAFIAALSGNDSCQEVIQVMFRLKTIVNDDPGHTVVRKTVFDCMGLLKNLLNNIEGE